MKRTNLLLALFACAFAIQSCKEPLPEPSALDPELTAESSVSISGKAGEYNFPYELKNVPDGAKVTASTEVDWIFDTKTTDKDVNFSVSNNLGARRSAEMQLKYNDCEKTVNVTQSTFEFDSFSISVKDITTSSAVVTIKPKAYQDNYFFEVIGKSYIDKFIATDANELGDFDFGEAFYQDDLEFLNEEAKSAGHPLEHHLMMSSSMYKVTSRGESTEMNYTTLKSEVEYYVVVYGMDFAGTRKTEICLYSFTTASPQYSDMTFTGSASNVTQTSARITVTPSTNSEYYFWTYVNETEYAKYSAEQIQINMVSNIKTNASTYGYQIADFLSKGQDVYDAKDEFVMGTTYTIFAWGMDTAGNITTKPMELFSFKTKANEITDDCTFAVEVTEVEPMDVKLKITPTSNSTRYYVAVINEKRCVGYNDYQMVQRILNMEGNRIENGEYGDGVTWANLPDLQQGNVEIWARRDLRWSFEPEQQNRIYVFGIDADGLCSTEIYRGDVVTGKAEPSTVTFEVTLSAEANWHQGAFDITPSNDEDYFMPFLIKTEELETYRYADGSLMEREVMDQIRDIYEDEISQYVFCGHKLYKNTWTSDSDYSLILFGYAGSNTTQMYEYQFHSPAIPFGKADSDISYTYELFNGDDLYAMNPTVWEGAQGDCVMKVNIKVTGNPENYYFGMWPPKENFASTGGIDHILLLCQNPYTTGDNIINKNFGILKPWWDGPGSSSGTFVTAEGETLRVMPWSITAYTEDSNYNYSPLHYEIFIPVQKPADQVTGKYEVGYREPYDFWSTKSSSSDVKTLVFNVSKPETLTNLNK